MVEEHLQRKVQDPALKVTIPHWQAPVHYEKGEDTAKVWVTIHGKTYQHKIRFHYD